MKKLFSIMLALVVALTLAISASGAGSVKVYGQRATGYAGSYLDIPLKIEKNTGFMGFKLTVSYSTEAFEVEYVVPSEALSNAGGLFNTNEYEKDTGKLDVMWTSTKNTVIEGDLVIIRLNVKGDAPLGGYTVCINDSHDDTFNEEWKWVELDCSDIIVNVVNKEEAFSTVAQQEPKELSKGELDNIVEKSLRQLGGKSIKSLTESEKEEFALNAKNWIKYSGGKVEIKNEMSADEKIEKILDLYPDDWNGKTPTVTYESKEVDVKKETQDGHKTTVIIVSAVAVVVVIAVIAVLCIKKSKKQKYEEESYEKEI